MAFPFIKNHFFPSFNAWSQSEFSVRDMKCNTVTSLPVPVGLLRDFPDRQQHCGGVAFSESLCSGMENKSLNVHLLSCHLIIKPTMNDEYERNRCFLGTALIHLRHLRYLPDKQIQDNCVGCCMSDVEHNLPALVSRADYQSALTLSHLSTKDLHIVGSACKLTLPESVDLLCLHGDYRLANARKDTSKAGEWWAVDLYDSRKSNSN
jgi:hypothetical protein